MDKRLIAERFSKAARTYSKEACIQLQIAQRMISLLDQEKGANQFNKIFEFGCGTGNYSQLLYQQFNPSSMSINDLCEEMINRCKETLNDKINYIVGDAESLKLPGQNDLITSCSTIQWFDHPVNFLNSSNKHLTDNGYLAFTTFGKENMKEIRETTGEGLSYLTLDEITQSLSSIYEVVHADEQIIEQYFDDPKQVLRHLKETGVTGISNQRWTPRILIRFCEEYGKLFTTNQGVRLTYHPIYIIAKKKSR